MCELHPLVGKLKKLFKQCAMENSSYFESLEAKAKERYHEKLSCVGGHIIDEPCIFFSADKGCLG